MLSPERIREACDPHGNPRWKQASQLSSGVDEQLMIDAFAEQTSVAEWSAMLDKGLRGGFVPKEIALKIAWIPKSDPWEVDSTNERRAIVLGGILGRCLANHLASILQDTVDPLLPRCAVAYRPRRREAVQESILRVATAVGLGGARYFAKLDVRDAFNSLPRPAVAAAMKALGYPGKFIRRMMESVGALRYRRLQGSWVEQCSDKGCPAGLPQSAILLNLLFLRLDREIGRKCPRIVYERYSDDLMLIGANRGEVEAAVRTIFDWMGALGLRLKGVSLNQSPKTVVHDIHDARLVYLGAEVREDGSLGIPSGHLAAQLAKCRYMLDRAADHAELVVGTSRYVRSGRRSRGLAVYGWDDVRASILEFSRYWSQLDEGESKVFLGRVREEFRMDPLSAASPYRKVWATALGLPDNRTGGGFIADSAHTSDSLTEWVTNEVLPLIKSVLDSPTGGQGIVLDEETLERAGTSDLDDTEMSDSSPIVWGLLGNEALTSSLYTPATLAPSGSIGTGSDANELYGSATDACGFIPASHGSGSTREVSEATALGWAPPPRQPWDADMRLIFTAYEFDPITETTRVRTDEFSELGEPLGCWAMTYEGPAETAVLDHLLTRLRLCGARRLVVAMNKAWLAKMLLQQGREVRSLALFRRVLALHPAGREVLIIGAIPLPSSGGPLAASRNGHTLKPLSFHASGRTV